MNNRELVNLIKVVRRELKTKTERQMAFEFGIPKSTIHRLSTMGKAKESIIEMFKVGNIDKYTLALAGKLQSEKLNNGILSGKVKSYSDALALTGEKRGSV